MKDINFLLVFLLVFTVGIVWFMFHNIYISLGHIFLWLAVIFHVAWNEEDEDEEAEF